MPKVITKTEDELLSEVIVKGLQEKKGHEIKVMDLRELDHAVADFFVVCHGDSSTQVQSLAESVIKTTSEELDIRPFNKEGINTAEWVLLDYFNIIVHIFHKEKREFYDIESLWGDAHIQIIED